MYFIFGRKIVKKIFDKIDKKWKFKEDIEFFIATNKESAEILNYKNHNKFILVCEINYFNHSEIKVKNSIDRNFLDFIEDNNIILFHARRYFIYNFSQLDFLKNKTA